MEKVAGNDVQTRPSTIRELEIIEGWGKIHSGTASEIKRQCPALKKLKVSEIAAICEWLVAEGRLQATKIPVRPNRYVGRSFKKSLQYLNPASTTDTLVG